MRHILASPRQIPPSRPTPVVAEDDVECPKTTKGGGLAKSKDH